MPVNITEEFVRFLMKQNKEQSAHIAELSAEITSLNQTIRELKEQLNQNSKTVPSHLYLTDLRSRLLKRIAISVNLPGKSRVLKKVMTTFI